MVKRVLEWLLIAILFGITIWLLLGISEAFAYSETDIWAEVDTYAMFFIQDDTIPIAWDGDANATYYEFEVLWVDPDPAVKIAQGQTPGTTIDLNRTRTGHIVLKVRSCNAEGCSDWCYSTDKDCSVVWVDPITKTGHGWLIFWRPAPPSGLGVN
jgi:hypothetical protein